MYCIAIFCAEMARVCSTCSLVYANDLTNHACNKESEPYFDANKILTVAESIFNPLKQNSFLKLSRKLRNQPQETWNQDQNDADKSPLPMIKGTAQHLFYMAEFSQIFSQHKLNLAVVKSNLAS